MRALCLALLLAGCAIVPQQQAAPVAAPAARPLPPEELTVCPVGPEIPVEPATPRTVEQVLAWAAALEEALERSEAARRECRRRLGALNEWIDQN